MQEGRRRSVSPPVYGVWGNVRLLVPGAVDGLELAGGGDAEACGVECGGRAVVGVEVDGVDDVYSVNGNCIGVQCGQSAGHNFVHEACLFEGYNSSIVHILILGGILTLGSGGTQVDVALVCGCAAIVLVIAIGGYVELTALDVGVAQRHADVLVYPIYTSLIVLGGEFLAFTGGQGDGDAGVIHPFAGVAYKLVGDRCDAGIKSPYAVFAADVRVAGIRSNLGFGVIV